MLISLSFDRGFLELPGRDFALEKDVQLIVRSSFELGQPEVAPDDAGCVDRNPLNIPDASAITFLILTKRYLLLTEECSLALPVPGGRVYHVRMQYVHDQSESCVGYPAECDSLVAKSSRGRLANDRIAYGT